MAVTKTRIYEFIRRCRNKALASIKAKHEALFEEAAVAFLAQPENAELKNLIASGEAGRERYNAAVADISALMKKAPWKKVDKWANGPLPCHYGAIKDEIFKGFTPSGSCVEQTRQAWAAEEAKVSDNYDALRQYAERHSAAAAYKYLIELGFDVTWINSDEPVKRPPETIDPAALFVCGEKGA